MGFRALDRATGSRTLRSSTEPASRGRGAPPRHALPRPAARVSQRVAHADRAGCGEPRTGTGAELETPVHGPSSSRTPPAGPLILGVLGGIASGKSTVARLLAGQRGIVISADE